MVGGWVGGWLGGWVGSIDGAVSFFWHQMRSMTIERPRLVEPMFVRDLRVGPIHLRQAAFWNLHPIYCERAPPADRSLQS